MRIWYVLGICLLAAGGGGPESAQSETEYYAVFMEGKKVGYTIQSRTRRSAIQYKAGL
jgi:hypothetical protein